MRIITTSAAALGAALLLTVAGTAPGLAKAHDQGVNMSPGKPDRAGGNTATGSTVGAAQTLGEGRGNRPSDKGPSGENPAAENAGAKN